MSIVAFGTSASTKKSSFRLPKPASSLETIDAFTTKKDPIVVVWTIKHPMNLRKT